MDCHKLPQCPNGPGLGGGGLGAWHMVIDVPRLWDLTKSTISARKPCKAAKPWEEGAAVIHGLISHPMAPLASELQPHGKLLLCFRWMENTPISHFPLMYCSDLPGLQKWVETLLVMGSIYRKCILKFILGVLRHHLHFWVSCHLQKVSSGTQKRFVKPGAAALCCTVREVQESLLSKMHRDPNVNIQGLRFSKNSSEISQESWSCHGPRGQITDFLHSLCALHFVIKLVKGLKFSFRKFNLISNKHQTVYNDAWLWNH